jgi:cytochrome c oxidase subunit 2
MFKKLISLLTKKISTKEFGAYLKGRILVVINYYITLHNRFIDRLCDWLVINDKGGLTSLIATLFVRNEVRGVSRRIVYQHMLELIWTIIPAIVLVIIAIPSIQLLYFMDYFVLTGEPIFTFKVIGHQWYWSYEYFRINQVWGTGESFILEKFDTFKSLFAVESEEFRVPVEFDSYMLPEQACTEIFGGLRLLEVDHPLFVPAFVCLRFLITSVDVLHSWAVPALGIKVDAVPGRLNQVYSIVKRPGIFYGQCSEICGVNHGFMPIQVVCLEPIQFGGSINI